MRSHAFCGPLSGCTELTFNVLKSPPSKRRWIYVNDCVPDASIETSTGYRRSRYTGMGGATVWARAGTPQTTRTSHGGTHKKKLTWHFIHQPTGQ